MTDPDVFLEDDIEYLRELRQPSSAWNGPPRYTVHCPTCGRGMRSAKFLEPVHWNPDGPVMCGACREWERRLIRTEPLRKPWTEDEG